MATNSTNRVRLAVFAAITFIAAFTLAMILLFTSKFSGSEFTVFVLAFAVLSVAVGFAPEIQEISIAGNVVKLREVKAEAVAAIESLNESRIEMLSIFLSLALKHGGGFGSGSVVDPRNYHFWNLVALSKKYQCFDKLKTQIGGNLHVLMISQIRQLQNRNDDAQGLDALPLPTVFELTQEILRPEGLAKAEARYNGKDLKPEIYEGLEEYLKLDQLRQELNLSLATMQPE